MMVITVLVGDIERSRAGGWHDGVVRDIARRQSQERLDLVGRAGILDEDVGAISLAGQQQVAIRQQLQAVRIGDRQRLVGQRLVLRSSDRGAAERSGSFWNAGDQRHPELRRYRYLPQPPWAWVVVMQGGDVA
jgi:hypothetical protein